MKKRILSSAVIVVVLFLCICGIKTGFHSTEPEYENVLLIYMCGSNLESKTGAATKNIEEMLDVDLPENTQVVITTGGAGKWRDYDISSEHISRYKLENGKLTLIETLDNASMGEKDTLQNFLTFANENFTSRHMGLIFWDHGGGSEGNVCYDEQYGMDSLTLSEMEDALNGAGMHFDFIGFDACMMAGLDMATMLSDYADYMIASEEIEPSGGWDYKELLTQFSSGGSMEELAKTVCDSYIQKCELNDKGDLATLSVLDLSKIETVNQSFGDFSVTMEEKIGKKFGNLSILSAADDSTKFGGNNATEGFSNRIDLYDFAKTLEESNDSSKQLCDAIDDMILYKVSGKSRTYTGGVSIYYPLVYDEEKLNHYLTICKSEEYKSFLNELYANVPEKTIEFTDDGSVAEDGSFQIALSSESKKYLRSVDFCLLEYTESSDNPNKMEVRSLGLDNDIDKDWDNLKFCSNFRGIWLGLEGRMLYFNVIESNDNRVIFSAPVSVNGNETNLRFSFIWDDDYYNGGYYTVNGLWNGIDEYGIADKEIVPLKTGDEVTPLAMELKNSKLVVNEGETFTIDEDGATVSEIPLSQKNYQYVYIVTDIFGNVFFSSTATFEMQYTYEQLLENPLPDGTYAAKITEIQQNVIPPEIYSTIHIKEKRQYLEEE